MSAAGLLAPAPAPAGAPPAPEYYPEEDEELESAEDDERSCRGRESDEDTEDASETDLAKHDEEDYVEMKEQMYQDKLASLKRQLQQLQEGTLQEYQKRMKKLDQQYKERIRNAELFLQLETEQVERNYIKEKKAAVKEFEDKKVELKENLIAELEEKKKMIENEKLTMELTGDSMEVKPIMTRKLRRRPNDPVPIPDKRRKPAPAQLNYLLTDEQIMEDLRTLNKLKSPKRPASPSSPEHLPATPAESPAQRFEARIEDGKLYYDKRWYHKSQAIYLESKDNQKLSCVISSVGANEIWVRKTSDSTKMRIYLGQLQRGLFVIRRRRTPSPSRECQQNGSSQHQGQADRNVNSISKLTPKALSHDSLKVSASLEGRSDTNEIYGT
nr:sin3 histone deacetylase corepressor complex component SDS3 isoform X3 [Globicephala melas]